MDSEKKYNSSFFPAWKTADPILYEHIKDNRKRLLNNMTPTETILWEYLKSNKLGVRFRRQHIIENFIPDFVALSCRLIIEVDGEIHNFQKEYDEDRTYLLQQRGFRVIRFTNDEVMNNIEKVIEMIKANLKPSTD
ncbi:MAG: endonuclease domain-containing protein [Paludibacter sp.]